MHGVLSLFVDFVFERYLRFKSDPEQFFFDKKDSRLVVQHDKFLVLDLSVYPYKHVYFHIPSTRFIMYGKIIAYSYNRNIYLAREGELPICVKAACEWFRFTNNGELVCYSQSSVQVIGQTQVFPMVHIFDNLENVTEVDNTVIFDEYLLDVGRRQMIPRLDSFSREGGDVTRARNSRIVVCRMNGLSFYKNFKCYRASIHHSLHTHIQLRVDALSHALINLKLPKHIISLILENVALDD